MTLEEQVKQWVDAQATKYPVGEGFFFDFSHVPKLKKPIITYFCDTLQWTLDYDNTFLRKPENGLFMNSEN